MNKQLALGIAFFVAIGATERLDAQKGAGASSTQVRIDSVRAIPLIYVPLHLLVSDQPVYVPYCGESEGHKFLCTVATHLEVATRSGWRPASLNTECGVLGGLSLDHAAGVLIEGGKEGVFTFEFSPRFFKVRPGQQLRVVIDAWPDEQSMKAGRSALHLVSPPFICP